MSNSENQLPSPRPHLWKVWLTASRPHTLTASVSPVLVGYFATLAYGGSPQFKQSASFVSSTSSSSPSTVLSSIAWRWLLFCVLIQLGTNLHNDYADFILGADDDKRVGHARATQKKWVTPFQMASAATSCLTLALVIGMSLITTLSATAPPTVSTSTSSHHNNSTHVTIVWFVILSSIFNAFAYTGGSCYPFSYLGILKHVSIGYSGMGDIVCFLYFGLVATMMIPYMWWVVINTTNKVATPISFDPSAWKLWWILACQVGCFATAILVVNNVRDRHTDVGANKRTTVVRFGIVFARIQYAVLVLTPYLLVLYTKWMLNKTDVTLLPLMTLPLLTKQLQAVSGGEVDGPALNPHVGGTARVQFFFCILQAISMYIYHTKYT